MVTETDTTIPAAAQQLAPADPIAAAIHTHKLAHAAHLATRERAWRLAEAVDPDMDFDDLDEVRAKMTAHYGNAAPAEIDRLLTARAVAELASEAEEAAWSAFLNTSAAFLSAE